MDLAGPSLSFNIFPKALAILPFPNFSIFFFFLSMVFLGIDTEFGAIESIFCFIKDEVKKCGRITIIFWEMSLQKVKALIVFSIMIFSPFLTCSAGIYYLDLFDTFAISVPLSACAIIEYYIFVRWIPFWQLQAETLEHTGEKAPRWIERIL